MVVNPVRTRGIRDTALPSHAQPCRVGKLLALLAVGSYFSLRVLVRHHFEVLRPSAGHVVPRAVREIDQRPAAVVHRDHAADLPCEPGVLGRPGFTRTNLSVHVRFKLLDRRRCRGTACASG